MTNLTEQWKKGNLDNGFYYIETDDKKNTIDYYSTSNYRFFTYPDERVMKVLANAPIYEQWIMTKNLSERAHLEMYKARGEKVKLEKENTKLKELLKEVLRHELSLKEVTELTRKIDQVLGEE